MTSSNGAISWPTIPNSREITVVEIRSPITHQKKNGKKFTDFEICLKSNSKAFTLPRSAVRRRYSDFVWLRDWLRENNEGFSSIRKTPSLPPKKILGRFEDEFIEERMKGLQRFLRKVIEHNVFLSDKALHLFLQSNMNVKQIESYLIGKPVELDVEYHGSHDLFNEEKNQLDSIENNEEDSKKSNSEQVAKVSVAPDKNSSLCGIAEDATANAQGKHSTSFTESTESVDKGASYVYESFKPIQPKEGTINHPSFSIGATSIVHYPDEVTVSDTFDQLASIKNQSSCEGSVEQSCAPSSCHQTDDMTFSCTPEASSFQDDSPTLNVISTSLDDSPESSRNSSLGTHYPDITLDSAPKNSVIRHDLNFGNMISCSCDSSPGGSYEPSLCDPHSDCTSGSKAQDSLHHLDIKDGSASSKQTLSLDKGIPSESDIPPSTVDDICMDSDVLSSSAEGNMKISAIDGFNYADNHDNLRTSQMENCVFQVVNSTS